MHAPWPAAEENDPAGQGLQDEEPCAEKVPAGQALQAAVPLPMVPAGQGSQPVLSALTVWPAGHALQEDEPTAAYLSAGQLVQEEVPPAEKVPAAQGWQGLVPVLN